MINLNKLAVIITKEEGGKQNLSIGQVKEVLKLALNCLAREKASEVLKLLESR